MLALIAFNARPGQPDPIDRDPGIISLVAAICRAVRKGLPVRAPNAESGVRMAQTMAWPVRGLWHIR